MKESKEMRIPKTIGFADFAEILTFGDTNFSQSNTPSISSFNLNLFIHGRASDLNSVFHAAVFCLGHEPKSSE